VAGHQRLANVTVMRPRQHNQALGADLAQPFLHHFGAAAVLVAAIGAGQQLAEAQITLVVLRQQQHPERIVAVRHVAEPQVAADDRLDALAARFLVKLDQAEDVTEIGQAQRRHAVGLGRSHGFIDAHDAINDGIFAVQAQMNERRLHGTLFYDVASMRLTGMRSFV
jgi:hypothetical protein